MKTATSIVIALTAASPALAHADSTFHTHGAELFVALAAVGIVVACAYALKR